LTQHGNMHPYVQWLTDEFIPYLKEWEDSVEKRKGFTQLRQFKSMIVMPEDTRNGIYITGINVYMRIQYIL